jgi:hypothetical protein
MGRMGRGGDIEICTVHRIEISKETLEPGSKKTHKPRRGLSGVHYIRHFFSLFCQQYNANLAANLLSVYFVHEQNRLNLGLSDIHHQSCCWWSVVGLLGQVVPPKRRPAVY